MANKKSRRALKNWMKLFFREEIFSPGGQAHAAMGRTEARFIREALELKKNARLLDLCCGAGRHAIPLSRCGLNVTGLDATPAYLRQAKRAARGLNARFLRGDMRRLSFKAEFDAAINLWTSFGYFTDPQDDLRVLRGVAKALKPGGKFLIDLVDADYLRKHAQPKRWDELPEGGYRLEDFHLFEGRDPGHVNTWTLLRPGRKPATATFFVRSYDYGRLSRLLRRAGLDTLRRWGGLDASPYRRGESRRLVLLARKPHSSSG